MRIYAVVRVNLFYHILCCVIVDKIYQILCCLFMWRKKL